MRRFFLLAAVLAGPLAAQEIEILPGHSDFRLPETRVVQYPMQLIDDWLRPFPESGEGAPTLELVAGIESDRLVLVLTLAGGGDDAVRAVQRRLEFIQTENLSWALMAYGFRQTCWRSGSDDWTDQLCP